MDCFKQLKVKSLLIFYVILRKKCKKGKSMGGGVKILFWGGKSNPLNWNK